MKQRIFGHFQVYLIQYIILQYQDLLLLHITVKQVLKKRLDDYDILTDWILPLARGLAIYSLTDR
jgi:hypothetical protein